MPSRVKPGAAVIGGLVFMAAMGLAAFGQAVAQPPGPRLGGPIETETLAPLNGWNVSGLNRGERGLPRSLWRQSQASALIPLLESTPTSFTSPTARALLRDALASPADAPQGDARPAARARIEALARLGAADEVLALAVGPMREDDSVVMFAAQAELAQGRIGQACQRLAIIDDDTAPPFVLRMRGVCFAIAGQPDAALLALELATAKNAGDPWLSQAIRVMTGVAATSPRTPPLTARYDNSLNAAVSLAAGLPNSPQSGLAAASLFAVRAVNAAENPPPSARAEIAPRLLRIGLIDPNDARRALAAGIDPTLRRPPRWIALVRDIQTAADAAAKARILAAAIDASTPAAEAAGVHLLFQADLRALAGDPAVLVGAASFARAAIAAGDLQTAALWRAKADRTRSDPRLVAALDAAQALLNPADANALRFAAERRADAGGRTALRDVLVLSVFGAPIQGRAEGLVLASPAPAPTASSPATQRQDSLLATLISAQQRGAAGEAALAAGALIADGPHALAPDALETVLKAMRGAGLDAYARRAAVEALLSTGPQTGDRGPAPARPPAPRPR
jgi:hypothetical protein